MKTFKLISEHAYLEIIEALKSHRAFSNLSIGFYAGRTYSSFIAFKQRRYAFGKRQPICSEGRFGGRSQD